MRRMIVVGLAWLCGMIAAPAFAQVNTVVGDWSGTSVAFDGVRRYAMSLNADETFVAVLALPNGTTQRVWGRYRAARLSSLETRVTFMNQGWRPLQVCVKEVNLLARCSPYTPLSAAGVAGSTFTPSGLLVKFSTSSSIQIDDTNWNRDSSHPLLLNQLIPDHLTLTSTRGQLSSGLPAVKKYGRPP